MFSNSSSLLTPPKLRPLSMPPTPTKPKMTIQIRNHTLSTPSKRCRVPLIIEEDYLPDINLCDLLPELSDIALNQSLAHEKSGELDEPDSPFTFESDNTINSDAGSLNSLSDLSSAPSSSPEFDKFTFVDPWNASSTLHDITFELGRIYKTSFFPSIKDVSLNTGNHCIKHEPCHRIKKPNRSILRAQSPSLNLLVSSSRGSLEDATIFATEINAALSGAKADKIPLIKSVFEKVTIPVNSEIKERHKRNRKKLLGEDYESESESENVDGEETPDAAFIKGFEIKLNDEKESNSEKRNKESKSVQWGRSLML